jgi:polar amino acid transport system permease protein
LHKAPGYFGSRSILEQPTEIDRKVALVPGAEPSARIDPWWWLVAVVVLVTVVLVVLGGQFGNIFSFVLRGLGVTLLVTVVSYFIMLAIGMVGGLGRLAKNRVIHGIASLYVEVVRGIPLLVQLIYWYFVVPALIRNAGQALNISALANYRANPILMAIIGLAFCYGAYMSEIFRAGIQSIPRGQMEAARSLGMSYFQAMRHIILPQAVRVILPPVGNEFVSLLKDSSLVSIVAVSDLTRRGQEYMATHFNPIETWTMIALLYLILTLFSSRVVAWLEKRSKYER